MFKFSLLHDHLCFAQKPRKTSQYLIKTDFPEGIMYFKTSEQQLFGRNLGCYLHYSQYHMRCYGFIFKFPNKKITEDAPYVTLI